MKTRYTLTAMAGASLLLAACTDPARLDPNANYTRDGAIIGGALGAVAGLAATGGTFRGAAAGAAVGAGAGAIAGSQMDRQAEELRASLATPSISVQQEGDQLRVTMPQDILFAVDSTEVNPALAGDLAALAANLNRYPDTRASIVGHTDNTGDAGYNQDLSVRRAEAISSTLVANGVAASRLSATGQGEDNPIASNLTEDGRAQNRRVDILIFTPQV